MTIDGVPASCSTDDIFVSARYYVDVTRLDREIQNRIEDLVRETEQISNSLSLWYAVTRMDSLRRKDMIGKNDPAIRARILVLEYYPRL